MPCQEASRGPVGHGSLNESAADRQPQSTIVRPGQIYARRPRRYTNASDCKLDSMCVK